MDLLEAERSAAHLHSPQERHGCGIIDDPLPKHQAVQQRVAILFQHLQHSDRVCGCKDGPQRQTVLQAVSLTSDLHRHL